MFCFRDGAICLLLKVEHEPHSSLVCLTQQDTEADILLEVGWVV